MPMRRRSADEEEFRIVDVTRNLQDAEHLLTEVGRTLNRPAIEIGVRPTALGGGRAMGRPVVWEWIASLQAVRARVAALMTEHDLPVPDDLPEGSWIETTAGSPSAQAATTALFGMVVVGLIVALVASILG